MVKIEFNVWKSPNYALSTTGESYALSDLEDKEFEDLLTEYIVSIRKRREEMQLRRTEAKKKYGENNNV